ncbi:cation:proton antiporter [Candidatus Gottesmanbacteria bacterium]|nr:cation:proton antiporter [Candidatus Gottesmanbacteria bacterium]
MGIVYGLVLILIAAFVGGVLAYKFRLPLLVGYLATGVIFSWVFEQYGWASYIESIAAIGVALLMFTLGIEFSLKKLKKIGEIVLIGSFVQIFLTIICGILVFPIFGFDFYNSLFLGAVFSLSSTAVVVKILTDKGQLDTLSGEITVGWLLVQDLATLPFIFLLPSLGAIFNGSTGALWGVLSLLRAVSVISVSLIVILFLGRRLIPWFLDKIAATGVRELLLVAVVALCLLSATIASYFGFSFALGAFVAGMLIASTSENFAIFSEVRPLRDIFSVIFFVSLGFLVNPVFILEHIVFILFLTFLVMVLKFSISSLLVLFLGYHTKIAFRVGVSLISVGEFAFILAQLGMSQKLITETTYMTILSVAMFSLAISTPILVHVDFIYRNLRKFLKEVVPVTNSIFRRFNHQDESRRLDLENHAVVLGHGRVGKYVSKALFAANIPYVVVDYNNHIVKNLRTTGIPVIYGDPSELDVLAVANIQQARTVIIAIPDRMATEMIVSNAKMLNPNIVIICRTHQEDDQKRLKSLGVDEVVQPEFEAAISIVEKLLLLFNTQMPKIKEKIEYLQIEHNKL